MCRNRLAKVYKHLRNKECLRKNQRKVYAKDLDAACWVKYPHNIKVVINTAQINVLQKSYPDILLMMMSLRMMLPSGERQMELSKYWRFHSFWLDDTRLFISTAPVEG